MAVTASPGPGRVLIALGAGPLVAEPSWTRFDNVPGCNWSGYDSFAGRQTEFDTTDTGTATVYFFDTNGTFNDSSLVGLQIMLQLYNPVANEWQIRWRGHIDDIERALVDVPGIPLANVSVRCTDIFDYLGRCKMLPGVFGDVAPAGMNGVVFYEDGRFDDRNIHLLTDALIPTDMYVVFTGNVNLNETLYDPDDSILQAIRDACDAEFPSGVANAYVDRYGRVAIHGRFARFDPEGTAASASNWDFTRWHAATREDVTTGVAQISEFSDNTPRSRILNTYTAWPRADENGVEFDRSLIATDMVKMDSGSISQFGYSGDDAPDLLTKDHYTNGNTGKDECELFAQFYVENYSQPRKAIQGVTFKSVWPYDPRAASTWDFMCRADISDAINLTVDEAGLNDEPYFIDGISVECRVLNPDYDLVTVKPNLTPASYFGTDVFSE